MVDAVETLELGGIDGVGVWEDELEIGKSVVEWSLIFVIGCILDI
jgi:hypothetical protein